MMDDEENVATGVVCAIVAGLLGVMLLIVLLTLANGCTPAERQTTIDDARKAAILSADVSACVMHAIATRQQEELRAQREAEAEAAIEADRLRSEMHAPSSVSQEVDKIVRGDAGAQ